MALIKKLTDIADAIREKKNIPESYETTGVWYRATGIDWFPDSHYYYYQDWPNVTQFKITIYDVQFNDACNTGCVFICSGNTQIRITYGEEYEYPYIGYVTVNSNSSKDYSIRIGGATTKSVTGAEVIAHYKIEPCDADGNALYETYTPAQMAEEIRELPEGITDNELVFSGDKKYMFSYDNLTWFIKKFGNRIIMTNITNLTSTFEKSTKLYEIPFDLYCAEDSSNIEVNSLFAYCEKLKSLPKVFNCKITSAQFYKVFSDLYNLREFPEGYFDTWEFAPTNSFFGWSNMMYCYSLRKIPMDYFKYAKSVGEKLYSYFAYGCYALDELVNIPIAPYIQNNPITSNLFQNMCNYTYRLQNMTFEQISTPVQWKSQVIDLSSYVGYAQTPSYILNYNSGITADKEVNYNDESYQALKDDPDWFTSYNKYSRYNHDSAVRTINSLPDTSEYLATAGGTNTIKFKGASGAKTDGGAINTLTEEEIAVATAKGWTVTLV